MRRRPALPLVVAATVLLSSGCAARFPRPEASSAGADVQQLVQDTGEPVQQTAEQAVQAPTSTVAGGTTASTPTVSGSVPRSPASSTVSAPTGTTRAPVAATASAPKPSEVERGSTDGVTPTSIRLALFVPKTGAAPVPPTIDAQAQNYWDYVASKGGIFGRNVTIKIYDTGSTEQGARDAVRTAVADKVLAAISLDRIAVEGALVKALHDAGVPHLINQMPHEQAIPSDGFYIGTDQVNNGRQIARYMAHTLKKKRVGFVGETDPTAYPARDAFVDEAKKLGLQVVHNEVVNGMDSQFLAEAQKLANDDAEAVWMYVAPNNAINISKEAQADGYHPVWVGSSISWGFNLVLSPASGALDGARSFSPWGGLDDPRYATYNRVNTEGRTTQDKDIGLPAWGYGQIIAQALKAAGPDPGRNRFREAMQQLKTGTTDTVTGSPMCWPPLDFTGGKRYGSGDRTIVMTVKGSGTGSVWATESDYRSEY